MALNEMELQGSFRAEALKCSADISKDKDRLHILSTSKKIKPPFCCL